MNTTKIARMNSTKYFIEYICEDLNNTYYQLVRTEDEAIFCAHKEIETVFAYCFTHGITCDEVSIW